MGKQEDAGNETLRNHASAQAGTGLFCGPICPDCGGVLPLAKDEDCRFCADGGGRGVWPAFFFILFLLMALAGWQSWAARKMPDRLGFASMTSLPEQTPSRVQAPRAPRHQHEGEVRLMPAAGLDDFIFLQGQDPLQMISELKVLSTGGASASLNSSPEAAVFLRDITRTSFATAHGNAVLVRGFFENRGSGSVDHVRLEGRLAKPRVLDRSFHQSILDQEDKIRQLDRRLFPLMVLEKDDLLDFSPEWLWYKAALAAEQSVPPGVSVPFTIWFLNVSGDAHELKVMLKDYRMGKADG